ncbi:extensin-like domain-containing protein [Aurantimonas marina]|uniref:extensin-like domain-containing protein n=1 Tax=Aurantimonas marina TaxID=2780508 RepID=UPI0019D151FC
MRGAKDRAFSVLAVLALVFASGQPSARAQAPKDAALPVPEARPDDGATGAREGEESKPKGGDLPAAVRSEGAAETGKPKESGLLGPAIPGAMESAPEPAVEKPVSEIPVPETRPDVLPESQSLAAPEASKRERAKPALPDRPVSAPVSDAPDPLKDREPAITPAAAVLAAAAIEDARMCEAELEKRGVLFTIGESISDGACGVLRPVNIERLSSGVTISSGTELLCRSALALDRWITDSVVPAAKANFPATRLSEFRHASTYVCRNRASENGISEHARGSAVDIAAFAFKDGKRIGVETQEPGSPAARFQRAVREGACGPFKTVLGPGTDADHATHFHLDIAARRNGGTYCK